MFDKSISGRIYILIIVAALAIGAALGFWVDRNNSKVENATVLEQARPIPNFTLTDNTGATFTNANLKDQWTLLFFGFTHCPDVCPNALIVINEALKTVKKPPVVTLVSVDPDRDTVKKLNDYVPYFNPAFKGLTGEQSEIKKLAEAVGVAYSKMKPEENGNYIVDHTSWFMLLNPQGQLHAYFSPPHIPAQLTNDLNAIIGR